jgi:hypothetical protein
MPTGTRTKRRQNGELTLEKNPLSAWAARKLREIHTLEATNIYLKRSRVGDVFILRSPSKPAHAFQAALLPRARCSALVQPLDFSKSL